MVDPVYFGTYPAGKGDFDYIALRKLGVSKKTKAGYSRRTLNIPFRESINDVAIRRHCQVTKLLRC